MNREIVLSALANRFRSRTAGKTGQGVKDIILPYNSFFLEIGAADGDEQQIVERVLNELDGDVIDIERNEKSGYPHSIRIPLEKEERLFQCLGQLSPTGNRARLAGLFRSAGLFNVPEDYSKGWRQFCSDCEERVSRGRTIKPLLPNDEIEEILWLLCQLLNWDGEALRRFVSSRLTNDSKRLDQLVSKLEPCLATITSGRINSLNDLGVLESPRSVLVFGSLELDLGETLRLRLLHRPFRIDSDDVERASIQTDACHCTTVENAAMLYELSRRGESGIYASSGSEGGFAHSAIIKFLKRIPGNVALRHFGDSDPTGFEILSDLRRRLERPVISCGMSYRPSEKGKPLTRADLAAVERLLSDGFLEEHEKANLSAMRSSGNKGRFEQESMTDEEIRLAIST